MLGSAQPARLCAGGSRAVIGGSPIVGKMVWQNVAYHPVGPVLLSGAHSTSYQSCDCVKSPRQAGEICPKLLGYGNTHFSSSDHISTRLLSARAERASAESTSRRRLSRRKHGRRHART